MGFPVIPFVVGAAVGSVSTYLAKDKAARDSVVSGVQGFVSGITAVLKRRKPVEPAVEAGEEALETGAEVMEQAAEDASEMVQDQPGEQPTH